MMEERRDEYIFKKKNQAVIIFEHQKINISVFDNFEKNYILACNKLENMIYDYIVKSFEYQSRKSVDGIEEGYGIKFLHFTKAYISSKLDMRYKQKMLKDFAKIFVKDFLENKLQTKYGVIYCVEDSEGKKYIG